MPHLPIKPCAACGRTITWRKKWQRCWDQVRYCSDRCRKQRPGDREAAIERCIVELLEQRQQGGTVCPSEVARSLRSDDGDWRALMEPVRSAARRLVAAGRLEITQRGQVVEPSTARGPIRLRLRRRS
ncbi:MAG: DUF2256 and DUF3253 domain-containing protein [bacterium]|nr:DUF2256 and DUF3253 domain-containing protein [bacterium]